jgi:hemolysin III
MSSLSLGLPAAGAQSPPSWRGRLHAAALMLAVPAAVALAWHHPDPPLVAYGVVLVALFAVSAAYHLLRLRPATHQLLRRVDHVMIFLYMATAYAPLCLRAVRGAFGWVILGLAWAVAAAGIALKTLSFARTRVLTGLL